MPDTMNAKEQSVREYEAAREAFYSLPLLASEKTRHALSMALEKAYSKLYEVNVLPIEP